MRSKNMLSCGTIRFLSLFNGIPNTSKLIWN
jgi:hypothetical protein